MHGTTGMHIAAVSRNETQYLTFPQSRAMSGWQSPRPLAHGWLSPRPFWAPSAVPFAGHPLAQPAALPMADTSALAKACALRGSEKLATQGQLPTTPTARIPNVTAIPTLASTSPW